MIKKYFSISLCLVALLATAPVLAQEKDMSAGEESQMPAFGPPEEMKSVAVMVGDWTFKGEARMSPDADWMPIEATASIEYAVGGAALLMEYEGPMMGMTMKGLSLTCFDRETGHWQETWVDNFSGRLSLYTGTFENGEFVTAGKDLMGGKEYFSRNTTFNITDTSFEWTMENSDDGEAWYVSMRGTYTKKQ